MLWNNSTQYQQVIRYLRILVLNEFTFLPNRHPPRQQPPMQGPKGSFVMRTNHCRMLVPYSFHSP